MEHETGFFPGTGGVPVFWRRWGAGAEQASLVLVPGAAEHSGRYHHVGRWFAARGLGVYALDHRGFGRSGGRRGHVDRFANYVEDLHLYMLAVHGRTGRRPYLVGHSMGGLVALLYALDHPGHPAGLVLSSPSLGLRGWQRYLAPLAGALLGVLPRTLRLPARIDPRLVSRDRWTWTAYAADPVLCRTATPGWVRQFLAALRRARREADRLGVPSLWLQARDDRLVDPAATRALFDRVGCPDKAFRWYPGRYHEIFNDPGREEVFQDILGWIRQRARP